VLTSYASRPLLLLLVEDSEPDIVLTTEAFEDARIAVDLVIAKDGPAALKILGEAAEGDRPVPELILLDLNLPMIDGLAILEHIKTHPLLKAIPVIVMSSSRSPADKAGAYSRHANSFISKPLDPDEFLRTIRGIENYWLTVVRLPTRA
jgi:CheY-like chemotaxis protein